MIEPKLIRPACRGCLSWDFRKQRCLRIMHGMACVVGDLPPRGAPFTGADIKNAAEAAVAAMPCAPSRLQEAMAAGADKCCDPPKLVAVDAPQDNRLFMQPGIVTNHDTKPTNPKDTIGIRKAPMSTVSAPVMAEIGVAMLEGAAKYGRHNYRVVGVRASVYYDATMRHLFSWWEGEDTDPDSGLSHVTKALASLVVLRDAMLNGKCEDDRPPRSAAFYPALNAKAAEILDKHADKTPKHYTEADRSLARAGLADDHDALTFAPRN